MYQLRVENASFSGVSSDWSTIGGAGAVGGAWSYSKSRYHPSGGKRLKCRWRLLNLATKCAQAWSCSNFATVTVSRSTTWLSGVVADGLICFCAATASIEFFAMTFFNSSSVESTWSLSYPCSWTSTSTTCLPYRAQNPNAALLARSVRSSSGSGVCCDAVQ